MCYYLKKVSILKKERCAAGTSTSSSLALSLFRDESEHLKSLSLKIRINYKVNFIDTLKRNRFELLAQQFISTKGLKEDITSIQEYHFL